MAFEGTGKYFWLLFIVLFIVYITVKVCLSHLLKKAKEQSWKAYVPFYTTLVWLDVLELKHSLFYLTLIPFVNLYYYNIIISKMLEGFGIDGKESIWFVVFPMYKFPELVFKNPRFILNEYDLTEGFLETQKALDEKKEEPINVIEEVNSIPEENTDINLNNQASVFTNQELEPNESQMTYVEAKPEEVKEEKPIMTPLDNGRPKMCPNCGATLSPSAKVCFLCGHKLGE